LHTPTSLTVAPLTHPLTSVTVAAPRAIAKSPAMVGMVRKHRRGAIELLCHEQPHQHVRERQGAE
jgi:hypothetical protein